MSGPGRVELYETQLGFLDAVVEEGAHGASRTDTLRVVLVEHVNDRLAGAAAYVGGTVRPDVLPAGFPDYGAPRWQRTLEPVTG